MEAKVQGLTRELMMAPLLEGGLLLLVGGFGWAIAGALSAPRIWASVIAVVLAVLFNLGLKASQPAAISTALLIASGTFQDKEAQWRF